MRLTKVDYSVVNQFTKSDHRYYVAPSATHVALVLDDGVTVSYLSYLLSKSKRIATFSFVFTLSDYRGKGYGNILCNLVEKGLRQKYPEIQVFKVCALPEAVVFYERLGFRPTSYKKLALGDVVYMEKPVNDEK